MEWRCSRDGGGGLAGGTGGAEEESVSSDMRSTAGDADCCGVDTLRVGGGCC